MKTLFFIISMASLSLLTQKDDFLSEQKKYARVRLAIDEKSETVKNYLQTKEMDLNNFQLLFVAYKEEDILEIYAKRPQDESYKLLHSYSICAKSGTLGPKRKQGDRQVPEGFYHIDRFNPVSSFHLSLGINYPNLSDKRKSNHTDLGGDIFIHGSCATIGCLPMTDDKIKEIYLLAVYAKNNGQHQIPVYIFPFKMTEENMRNHRYLTQENVELLSFWQNLKSGYDLLIKEKKNLNFKIEQNGDYSF